MVNSVQWLSQSYYSICISILVEFSRLSLKKVLQADESEDEEVEHGEELNTRFEKRSHSGNITSAYDHRRRYA